MDRVDVCASFFCLRDGAASRSNISRPFSAVVSRRSRSDGEHDDRKRENRDEGPKKQDAASRGIENDTALPRLARCQCRSVGFPVLVAHYVPPVPFRRGAVSARAAFFGNGAPCPVVPFRSERPNHFCVHISWSSCAGACPRPREREEETAMKTFLLGLLTAAAIAILVSIGLQFAEMAAANAQSTEPIRFSQDSGMPARA